MHGDDLYANDKVIEMVAKEFEADSSLDGVYGDLVYVHRDDTSKIIRYWKSRDYDVSLLSKGWVPPHPSLFLTKDIYVKFGLFDLNFKISADYDFMIRILKNNIKLKYLTHLLYKMRVGGTSNNKIKNFIYKSKEDCLALRKNGLGSMRTLIMKKLSKVKQFLI